MSLYGERDYQRQENKRLRGKLATVQRLLHDGLGATYMNAPAGSPLAEVRRILRGE